MVSGSDTSTGTEGHAVSLPGTFTQIPSPRDWSNGDDLSAGRLNKEWRDAFLWVMRKNAPAFEGYNNDGAALTLVIDAAIPIKTEELKHGNLTHAANDSKVYVWETGWYSVWAQVGITTTSAVGTNFACVIKKNGVLKATCDTTRGTGSPVVIEQQASIFLTAGDYIEIAAGGSWTGTATSGVAPYAVPILGLWWRSNA